MTTESSREDSSTEEDRVVSRRVDNPTSAGPDDERAYRAADPTPDSGAEDSYRGATGGVSEHAEGDVDDEGGPAREE